jgi:TPR repeat protein
MKANKATAWILGLLMLMQTVVSAAEVAQWNVFEASYESAKVYSNAFTEVEVNVVFSHGDQKWVVPAFWAGDTKWIVRFAPPAQGKYTYRVECTDKANTGLNGKENTLSVEAYKGDNPLMKHGFVKANPGKHYFEHADGTPFLWLADTWWKCLCKRMTWEGFQELTADRKARGFSVVQIVCGPYPDENFFAPSLENEGGQPYLVKDMSWVNPKYFDYADRRFKHLVDSSIVPAIVGAWGRGDCNSMDAFGPVSIKRHWRYLIARYGAYPVVWILAGEIADETKWGEGPWAEVAKYVREIDPYKHPLTCHTGQGRRGAEGDVCLIDYDMVGGNHDERQAVADGTLKLLTSACAKKPAMPVLCGETCYEGHMQQGFGDVQRHIFWRNMLSGAGGHTYGAAGIWHAGVEGDHGNWGAWDRQPYDWTTWKEGVNYPASRQLGMGKQLLEKYPWQKFEPHPEWAPGCFAAGIPGEVRFVYLPRRDIYNWDGPEVKDLEPDVDWHVYYFDPAAGRKFDQGVIKATAKAGDKDAKPVSFKKNVPSPQDWVLVLEKAGARNASGEKTSSSHAEKETTTEGLKAKAARGDIAAQLSVAFRYRDGKGVKRDYSEAMRWGHPAADQGDAAAMDFVGWMFFEGLGVKHNPTIAAGYFKAAAGESATAAWNWGQCCFGAQGVDQDIPKALEVWKQAAAMGHGRAASTAAMVYLAGEGIAPDMAEARKLAERAAELNDPSGLVVLGEIEYQAGEIEPARAHWAKVSQMKPVGPTGHPEQPSDNMAAQQGADLLKLIDYRRRKPEPGKFALVPVPHIHQGWNNCGATSCAMLARSQGKTLGGWDYKRLCPSPLGTGTDWGDLLNASEKIGLRWKLVTFTPDDAGFDNATTFVRSELDAGRPVVIDFKFTGPDYPDGEAGHTLAIALYLDEENLYILCNPAIATPGLQFITAVDLKHFWRSDHYGGLSNNVLSRPAIVIDTPQ